MAPPLGEIDQFVISRGFSIGCCLDLSIDDGKQVLIIELDSAAHADVMNTVDRADVQFDCQSGITSLGAFRIFRDHNLKGSLRGVSPTAHNSPLVPSHTYFLDAFRKAHRRMSSGGGVWTASSSSNESAVSIWKALTTVRWCRSRCSASSSRRAMT